MSSPNINKDRLSLLSSLHNDEKDGEDTSISVEDKRVAKDSEPNKEQQPDKEEDKPITNSLENDEAHRTPSSENNKNRMKARNVTSRRKTSSDPSGSIENLTKVQEEEFHSAMSKLRGLTVPKEVQKLMHEMTDEPETNHISVHEFQEALVGSRWILTLSEASACACYMGGKDAKSINYVDFANLIESKLSSKEEDENVRLKRQFDMMRRVSVNGSKKVDLNEAKKRWGRMNAMADKAKEAREKRKAEFMAKIREMNAEARKQKEIDEERKRAKAERLKLSHMTYREQAKYMLSKQKKLEEEEKKKRLEELKAANQRKYCGVVKTREIFRDGPGIEYIDVDMQALAFDTTENDSEPTLFDGNVQSFGPIGPAKPFSDDVFTNGIQAQFKNSSVLGGEFETWEKHLDSNGKAFFYSPRLKKSVWNLPSRAVLVDRTADDIDEVNQSDLPGVTEEFTVKESDQFIFAAHPSWNQHISYLAGVCPSPPKTKKNIHSVGGALKSPRAKALETKSTPKNMGKVSTDGKSALAAKDKNSNQIASEAATMKNEQVDSLRAKREVKLSRKADLETPQKKLPPLLHGDSERAIVLRRLSRAFDKGGADPFTGLDLRGFKGRNLTKKQFRVQCRRCLGVTLTKKEVELVFECFDKDGGGTLEYNEFLLGLKGPLCSALSRLKNVLDENRIHRDMRSFQGRSLDKEEFAFQCKAVLSLELLPSELDAVFAHFDNDGGGTIDYGEILLQFTKLEDMDVVREDPAKWR